MTEEQVTKAILKWLLSDGWEIVCFDFPQSGTGRLLHPDNSTGEKNRDAINPDIVAVKGSTCVFFENKDRFYFPDYQKINLLITDNHYTLAIEQLLAQYSVINIYYGIGLPSIKHKKGSQESIGMVDFIVGVEENREVNILYQAYSSIFS